MQSFTLSAAGVRMPRMIYGTAWKKTDTARLVELALRTGFRGIDTACQPKHYDEAGVGAGIVACLNTSFGRADLYLQSKYTPASGQDPRRIPYDPKEPLPAQVAKSFAASLRHLRTDYLDCLVLHSPLPTAEQTMTVWRAFEALIDAGHVRQLGISNCYRCRDLETLYQRARIKPAVVQNRFSAENAYDREIRTFCTEHKLVYQSFWTLTANPHILGHPIVTTLAATYARKPAQIVFRYLTQADVVPLVGTKSENHMRQDLAIFDFALTSAERLAIDGLLQGIQASA